MKRTAALLIICCALLTACTRSTDDISNPSGTPASGNWKINLYWDSKDETSNFSTWSFNFQTNGTVSATSGATTISGTWIKSSSKFQLNFGNISPLADLNHNWLIVEYSSTIISLKDDNPSQDDQVKFVKL